MKVFLKICTIKINILIVVIWLKLLLLSFPKYQYLLLAIKQCDVKTKYIGLSLRKLAKIGMVLNFQWSYLGQRKSSSNHVKNRIINKKFKTIWQVIWWKDFLLQFKENIFLKKISESHFTFKQNSCSTFELFSYWKSWRVESILTSVFCSK